jgi:hypothetical protein
MGQPWITLKIKFNRKANFMGMKASEDKIKRFYKSKLIRANQSVSNKLLNHNLEAQKFLSVQVLDISCADSGNKLLIL